MRTDGFIIKDSKLQFIKCLPCAQQCSKYQVGARNINKSDTFLVLKSGGRSVEEEGEIDTQTENAEKQG